ncbi:MAG: GntR family transcriptional regulator [Treponema sp.]|jgi:DNA-binding GntR family transcriptional regulator|nr:GntR family transcriptional regulator [Treponema sp.]
MESIDVMPMRVRIASRLRKAILAGEFKEGQSLSLTETSKQLGISRTPVREAFQTLEAEGFIELRMNKHALVRGITVKFIQDHYKTRIILEGEAAYCAAENNMDITPLVERNLLIKNKSPGFTADEFAEYNQWFHVSIWDAADNQRLRSLLMGFWNGASVGRAIPGEDHFIRSIKEHEQITAAIKNHRAADAKRLMGNHIFRGMQNILKSYQDVQAD